MLINFFNNSYFFNYSALNLINSSLVSVNATYFLILVNFIFLFFVLFKVNKLFTEEKITLFNAIVIIGIYGSFSKLMAYSIYDEIIIFIIILIYCLNNKFRFYKSNFNYLLIGFFLYLIIHSILFYKTDFSLMDHLRYIRILMVLLLSLFIFISIKNKKINYNSSLNFCFLFILFLIIYSFFGDIFYRNFQYLREPLAKNPNSLFYDTGGPGKFIIQNFIVSGSRNFSLLCLLTMFFLYKSTFSYKKKIIIFTSLLFLSLYNHASSSIYLIIACSIFLGVRNFKFLKVLTSGFILSHTFIVFLFILIHSIVPIHTNSVLLQNINVTVKYILRQITIIPDELLVNLSQNSKNQFSNLPPKTKETILNLNLQQDVINELKKYGISKISQIVPENTSEVKNVSCEGLGKLELHTSIKKELCERAKILKRKIDNNETIENFDVMLSKKRLRVKPYRDFVRDTIRVKKGDYYLFEGLEFEIKNHALAEAMAHFIGVLDKDRGLISIFFGSGLNSHRTELPISISKLLIEYQDDDKDEDMIKQNLNNLSFSSYTGPSILFELGFVLILFFIGLIYSTKKKLSYNYFFLFLLISVSFLINYNDAIIFYIILLYFIQNEEKDFIKNEEKA